MLASLGTAARCPLPRAETLAHLLYHHPLGKSCGLLLAFSIILLQILSDLFDELLLQGRLCCLTLLKGRLENIELGQGARPHSEGLCVFIHHCNCLDGSLSPSELRDSGRDQQEPLKDIE